MDIVIEEFIKEVYKQLPNTELDLNSGCLRIKFMSIKMLEMFNGKLERWYLDDNGYGDWETVDLNDPDSIKTTVEKCKQYISNRLEFFK